ncbi:hypothetical protein ACR1PO_03875 [Chryseobacterium sp. RRHN12]|uniref:hypothetical protein n=1 Tax=Chryseobacterium sp. RRHN12 TaxID=3437884 RepID=UPI002FC875EC
MRKTKTAILTALLLTSLVITSCVNSNGDNEIENNSTNKKSLNVGTMSKTIQDYTGEELYASIFFAYGDFAKNLSIYNDDVQKYENGGMVKEELFKERFSKFVSVVKSENPNYFENFKTEIESKDHLRIQNALKDGFPLIYDNLGIMYPELADAVSGVENDPELQDIINKDGDLNEEEMSVLTSKAQAMMEQLSPCSPLVCVGYFAFAIHNTIGLTMNVGIYMNFKWWGPKLEQYNKGKSVAVSGSDPLIIDVFVNDIATAP